MTSCRSAPLAGRVREVTTPTSSPPLADSCGGAQQQARSPPVKDPPAGRTAEGEQKLLPKRRIPRERSRGTTWLFYQSRIDNRQSSRAVTACAASAGPFRLEWPRLRGSPSQLDSLAEVRVADGEATIGSDRPEHVLAIEAVRESLPPGSSGPGVQVGGEVARVHPGDEWFVPALFAARAADADHLDVFRWVEELDGHRGFGTLEWNRAGERVLALRREPQPTVFVLVPEHAQQWAAALAHSRYRRAQQRLIEPTGDVEGVHRAGPYPMRRARASVASPRTPLLVGLALRRERESRAWRPPVGSTERTATLCARIVEAPAVSSSVPLFEEVVLSDPLPGLVVRPATEADGPALAEIDRQSPVVAGDSRVTVDRGEDYYAASRLMEECDVVLAELDGRAIAVHCAAFFHTQIGKEERHVNYIHHLRVLPEFQGHGIFGRLKEVAVPRYPADAECSYAYVDAANQVSARMRRNPGYHLWPVTPVLLEVDTRRSAGPAYGRPATVDDADDICAILNEAHERDEFWRPLTPSSLAARLSRDPDQYGWQHLLFAEDAVAGVWQAGRSIAIVTESPGGRRVSRQGNVLDHGYLPGAQKSFLRLLRSWCSTLADAGLDHLAMFAIEGTPSHAMLEPLAANVRRFDFWTTRIPAPAMENRSLFVDHIYF